MTPEQEALNVRIAELPVIIGLKEKDDEIIEDLEGLKEGLKQLSEFVHDGFTKGTKRMDGIEGEVREVKDEVRELSRLVVQFFTEARNMNAELKTEIRDGKIQELSNKLDDKKKEEDRKSAFKSGLLIGLSVLGVGTLLSILGYLFIKAYG